jgi:hypothetical protein
MEAGMSIFDQLMAQAPNLDLAALGARVGLTPEQVAAASRDLLPQIADPAVDNQAATAEVAAGHGIAHSQLQELLPALLQQAQSAGASGGALQSVLSGLGGGGSGGNQGSILGGLGSAIDRDGDGNPINDIMGMFGGNRTS